MEPVFPHGIDHMGCGASQEKGGKLEPPEKISTDQKNSPIPAAPVEADTQEATPTPPEEKSTEQNKSVANPNPGDEQTEQQITDEDTPGGEAGENGDGEADGEAGGEAGEDELADGEVPSGAEAARRTNRSRSVFTDGGGVVDPEKQRERNLERQQQLEAAGMAAEAAAHHDHRTELSIEEAGENGDGKADGDADAAHGKKQPDQGMLVGGEAGGEVLADD